MQLYVVKENYIYKRIATDSYFSGNVSAGKMALQSDQVVEYMDDLGHTYTYYVNTDPSKSTTTEDRDVDNGEDRDVDNGENRDVDNSSQVKVDIAAS